MSQDLEYECMPGTDAEESQHLVPVSQERTDMIPKLPVSAICSIDDDTLAAGILLREGYNLTYSMGELHIIDIDVRTPTVSIGCLGAISRLLKPKQHSNVLLGGSSNGAIHIWDIAACTEAQTLAPDYVLGHINPIVALESLDHDSVLSVDTQGKALIWSLRNPSKPVTTMNWSPRSEKTLVVATCYFTQLYCGTISGSIYRCSTDDGPHSHHKIHDSMVTSISPCVDGNIEMLATSSIDGTIKVWDTANLEEPIFDVTPSLEFTRCVSWNPVHPYILVSTNGKSGVHLWNLSLPSQIPVCSSKKDNPYTSVSWHPKGTLILAAGLGIDFYEAYNEVLLESNCEPD